MLLQLPTSKYIYAELVSFCHTATTSLVVKQIYVKDITLSGFYHANFYELKLSAGGHL